MRAAEAAAEQAAEMADKKEEQTRAVALLKKGKQACRLKASPAGEAGKLLAEPAPAQM